MPEGVWADYPMEVVWEGDQRYRGGRPGGATLVVDGGRQAGPSPVETMLVSLAACSSIDVVEVLNKRRTPPTRVEVQVKFARAAEAPRRLTAIHLLYRVATDSAAHHVARAVELSVQKYCSVVHSLKEDIDLEWEVEVEAAAEPATR
jgi:putative redox protein